MDVLLSEQFVISCCYYSLALHFRDLRRLRAHETTVLYILACSTITCSTTENQLLCNESRPVSALCYAAGSYFEGRLQTGYMPL